MNVKQYFLSTHNKLLSLEDPGQPDFVIPDNWYNYTRLDVTPQTIRQYTELAFEEYKRWEEHTKDLYQDCAKTLIDMGNISDAEEIKHLIQDVTCELQEIYNIITKLKSANFDIVYMFDMQDDLCNKYK